MTAEIIPFRRPKHESDRRAAPPAPYLAKVPQPASIPTTDALPVDIHSSGDSVVAASLALTAACREMAASLALLIAHCESADNLMAEMADGAGVAADGGNAIGEATACLTHDVTRAMDAVSKAARAATQA